jgi:hypothetical protein
MNEALRIQQEIKKYEGELVVDSEKLIDEDVSSNGRRIYHGDTLEEKQIRNVLDVALEADCVEVISNFIKYQIGRARQDEKWKFGGFGDALINKVSQGGFIYKIANEKIVPTLRQKDRTGQYNLNPVWLKLVRLYLGYLNRHFYYRKNENQ